MTVDELSAMIDECAGESVLHEAYAVDPEQTRTTLEKLVDDWNAGKDFDPAVYDLLMGRVVERDGDSTMQTGWLKQQAVSEALDAYVQSQMQSMEHYLEDQYQIAASSHISTAPTGEVILVCCENPEAVMNAIKTALAA